VNAAAERARALIDVGRHCDAANAAQDGLRSDPTNPELMGLIARALYQDGHPGYARGWAERALAVDPQLAWVHQVRTWSILDGAGHPQEAAASAWTAAQLNPGSANLMYDLCRACLAVRDLAGATWAAEQIRRIDPTTPQGPLAAALVEIGRVRTLRLKPVPAVLVVILSHGAVLAIWGLWWLALRANRIGHLRRADGHVKDALRLAPGSAGVHKVAAVVANLRLRYADSIDRELAAAAIDSGEVSADELVTGISRRTTVLSVATFAVWLTWILWLQVGVWHRFESSLVAGVIGGALGWAATGVVCWFYRAQTRNLPPVLSARVRQDRSLAACAGVLAVILVVSGLAAVVAHITHGFGIACLITAVPVVAGSLRLRPCRRQ
jgi:tetratricopeptide (TPR) repeat protein